LEGLLYKGNDVAVAAAAVVAIAIAVVPGKDSFAWSPTLQNQDTSGFPCESFTQIAAWVRWVNPNW